MLQPSKTKHRKIQKGRVKGVASRGHNLSFGDYGLQTLEHGLITARQIEAARMTMTHATKRGGKLWIRVFPDKPVSKKPAEVRMGKGKGNPEFWVAPVKRGRMLYELAGVERAIAVRALELAAYKLPVKTKIVEREAEGYREAK